MIIVETPESFSIIEWECDETHYFRFQTRYKNKKGVVYGSNPYNRNGLIRSFHQLSKGEANDKGSIEKEYKNVPAAGFVLLDIQGGSFIEVHDPRGFNISVDYRWFSSHILPKVTIDRGVIQEDMIYHISDSGGMLVLAVAGEEQERKVITKLSDFKKGTEVYISRDKTELIYLGQLNDRHFEGWHEQKSHYLLQLDGGVIKEFDRFPGRYYGRLERLRPVEELEKEMVDKAINKYKQYYRSTSVSEKAVSLRLLDSEMVVKKEGWRSHYSFYKYLPSGRVLEATSNVVEYANGSREEWNYCVYAVNEKGGVAVEQVTSWLLQYSETSLYNKYIKCTEEDLQVLRDEWENKEKTFKNMSGWVYRVDSDFMVRMEDGRELIHTYKDIVI